MKKKDVISFFCILSYIFLVFGGLHLYLSNEDDRDLKNAIEHRNNINESIQRYVLYSDSVSSNTISICVNSYI